MMLATSLFLWPYTPVSFVLLRSEIKPQNKTISYETFNYFPIHQ